MANRCKPNRKWFWFAIQDRGIFVSCAFSLVLAIVTLSVAPAPRSHDPQTGLFKVNMSCIVAAINIHMTAEQLDAYHCIQRSDSDETNLAIVYCTNIFLVLTTFVACIAALSEPTWFNQVQTLLDGLRRQSKTPLPVATQDVGAFIDMQHNSQPLDPNEPNEAIAMYPLLIQDTGHQLPSADDQVTRDQSVVNG
jgi:hypothetical protein